MTKKKKNALTVIGGKLLSNIEGKIDLRITKNDLVTVKVHEREKEIKSELDSVRQEIQVTSTQRTALSKQIKAIGQSLAESSYAKKSEQLMCLIQEISAGSSKGMTTNLASEVERPREGKKASVTVTFIMDAAEIHLQIRLKPVKASKELLSTQSKIDALGSKYDTLRDQEDKLSMEYNDIPRLEREAQAEVTKGLLEKAGLTTD